MVVLLSNISKQRVKCNNTISKEIVIDTQVLPRSILTRLLFIVYINAIFQYCEIYLFADDTVIYKISKNKDYIGTVSINFCFATYRQSIKNCTGGEEIKSITNN